MYEPSKQVEQFALDTFKYHDGALVLDQLKPGCTLEIREEFDNPYDPNALALYFKGRRVGYIPRRFNWVPSQVIRFGHKDVFEVRVLQVAPMNAPDKQVYAALYVRDVREIAG